MTLEGQRHWNAVGLQATASSPKPIGKAAGAHPPEGIGHATRLAEGCRYTDASRSRNLGPHGSSRGSWTRIYSANTLQRPEGGQGRTHVMGVLSDGGLLLRWSEASSRRWPMSGNSEGAASLACGQRRQPQGNGPVD